jgi:valyl-tRNA synthetase
LLKLNRISFDKKTDKIIGVAYLVVDDTTLTIPLKNIVDTKKEIEKLQIKKQKEISNFKNLENKLKNSGFINNASEEVIEKFKKQSIDIKSSIDKIDQIIDTINS